MYLEIGRMIWIASDGSRGVRWIAKIGIRFLAQSDQNQLVGPLRCSPFHLHRTANYYFFPGKYFLVPLIRRLPKSPNFQPVTLLGAILLLDPQIKDLLLGASAPCFDSAHHPSTLQRVLQSEA
jgi:hypothetical protein